jgi:hypothetical protein
MRPLISALNALDASSRPRALVPVALAARAAGHEVMVTGPADLAGPVTGDYGLAFRPDDDLAEDLAALTRTAGLGTLRRRGQSSRRRGPGGCCCPGLVVCS